MVDQENKALGAYAGPILVSVLSSGLMFLFIVSIVWLNHALTFWVVFFLALSLVTYVILLYNRRYYSYALLLPLLLSPVVIISFGGMQMLEGGVGVSRLMRLALVLGYSLVTLLYIYVTSRVYVREVDAGGEVSQALKREKDKSYQSVARFIRMWQWILLLTWLLPNYAIFFEQRLEIQYLNVYGKDSLLAQILSSMLLFLVWLVVGLTGFLTSVQSMTYYPMILRKRYGRMSEGGRRRSYGILYTLLGVFFILVVILFKLPFMEGGM